MEEQNQEKQNESVKTKKDFWSNISPKMTFVLGLVVGIAVFASLSLLYSFLALGRTSEPAKIVDNNIENNQEQDFYPEEPSGVPFGSFVDTGWPICQEDGKPIVRLFSTTWCPHCSWIKDTFDQAMKEYIDQGKIIARHWEFDTNNNTLTEEVEGSIPPAEEVVFDQFNPHGSIPTFVFGCRYYRIGNAYSGMGDEEGLQMEGQEFRDLVEKMLTEI